MFPLLKKEVAIENYGKDYVRLVLKNRSVLDVVGALDSTRGGRRHGGLIDEVRDHDGQILNEVVLPQIIRGLIAVKLFEKGDELKKKRCQLFY